MTKKVKNEKLSEAMKGNKNALGNEGGAPSKYKKEYCEQIVEFFNINPYEETILDNGRVQRTPNQLPTLERFASNIGVVVQTMINWCDEDPEFLEAYERAKQLQKNVLIQNGLIGGYNAQFAMFVGINATDMKSKQEVDHISSNGSMATNKVNLTDEQVKIVAQSLAEKV